MADLDPRSEYMRWAKLHSGQGATCLLTSSGVPAVPLAELQLDTSEISTVEHPYGYAPLVELIGRRHGVAADRIFTVSGGTSMANFMIFELLVAAQDEVIIERPAYGLLYDLAHHKGVSVVEFERDFADGFQPDLSRLERLITPRTKLVVLTNLHNPSGALLGNDSLLGLRELARKHGIKVLIDEVYLDAVPGQQSAACLGAEFIVTSSLTKVYGLGYLRAGWVAADPEIVAKLWALHDVVYGVAPLVEDYLQEAAWRRLPQLEQRTRQLLQRNHRIWEEFVRDRNDLRAIAGPYGTTVFPRLAAGSVDRLDAYLRAKHQTAIVPGRFFGAPQHLRISMCCGSEVLQEGLARLGLALAEPGAWA